MAPRSVPTPRAIPGVAAPLLDRAEAANDQVVLVAGPASGEEGWTDFYLQQADRILAIGDARPTPWGSAQACPGGCDLVALNVAEGSGACRMGGGAGSNRDACCPR